MPAPASIESFLELGYKSGLLEPKAVEDYRRSLPEDSPADTPRALADAMVRDGLLTSFQADSLMVGKWRGFIIAGKYRLLQKVGAGGMGCVYLCEHMHLRCRRALKVLPLSLAKDPDAVERFYREGRAVAALDHPNIVRVHDIDHEENVHFLVLEYIDGSNLHDVIRRRGPLAIVRAAHYIRQAALGLQHAFEAGLVHRDIKPGNILLDRNGVVKVLDMGLARFFDETEENLSADQEIGNVLGTADYLAPEQVQDSRVDVRADIYSLGVTFYYLLSGQGPFAQGTVSQKLIWHQVRQPKPIRALRPELPEELAAIIDKMMAKDPEERYQTPAEVVEALNPWTQSAIPPPSEAEMPPLGFGARGSFSGTGSNNTPISRGALSPLGLRSSPATPISRAPRKSGPRTAIRPVSTPVSPPPAPAGTPAASNPPSVPEKPAGQKSVPVPADPLAPTGDSSDRIETVIIETKQTEIAPEEKKNVSPAKPATKPVVATAGAKPASRPTVQAPTKGASAMKAPPTKAPAAKSPARPVSPQPSSRADKKPPVIVPEERRKPSAGPTPAELSSEQEAKGNASSGNIWIVVGAAILALGLATLLWALL